jgi:hypothetical protein
MSWFGLWKQPPPASPSNLAALHREELADEKVRVEIEKLRVEASDERSWRAKLLLSLIIPLGGAVAFLNTWHSDHASERARRSEQLYTDAAQQLSSQETSVRLNAILTLSAFITERGWLAQRFLAGNAAGDCGSSESVRGRQSVALIIGDLISEPDASALDTIANVADAHPCLTAEPLLSADRSAAVQFARAAGSFAGKYILRRKKAVAFPASDDRYQALRQQAIGDINNITLRTGSPFEARDLLNESFVSRTFLSIKCPFFGLFDKQLLLAMSVYLTSPLQASTPDVGAVQSSLQKMEDAAAVLEKSSYVLAKLASTARGMDELQRVSKRENLYGVAIVVGQMEPSTITKLQGLGAYVQQYGVEGVCTIPQNAITK